MHIHANQTSPNLQLETLYAAERASAKKQIERTRKKLMEFASRLSAEGESAESSIVTLESKDESQEPAYERNRQNPTSQITKETPGAKTAISDWA